MIVISIGERKQPCLASQPVDYGMLIKALWLNVAVMMVMIHQGTVNLLPQVQSRRPPQTGRAPAQRTLAPPTLAPS